MAGGRGPVARRSRDVLRRAAVPAGHGVARLARDPACPAMPASGASAGPCSATSPSVATTSPSSVATTSSASTSSSGAAASTAASPGARVGTGSRVGTSSSVPAAACAARAGAAVGNVAGQVDHASDRAVLTNIDGGRGGQEGCPPLVQGLDQDVRVSTCPSSEVDPAEEGTGDHPGIIGVRGEGGDNRRGWRARDRHTQLRDRSHVRGRGDGQGEDGVARRASRQG